MKSNFNDMWFFNAGIWICTGTINALNSDYSGVAGSIFAIFMCLIYRQALNKIDELKDK